MPKKTLIIDNYIGQYGYSKQWVNHMLSGADNDEIEVQISSLGGSVDHEMAIHDRFAPSLKKKALKSQKGVSKAF